MRLGLNLGYRSPGSGFDDLTLAQEADRLGYAVVWVAEAYGSDAPSVLAWLAAKTERIELGSAIMQIPARTPAMTAMTAATLDALSGGRFRLGLGVSGPQVSEGWHGVRFDDPLGRTREYVDIVRRALRGERLSYHGRHYVLPLPDGPGKALKLTIGPVRPRLPIYLAALGPRNLQLTGEIAEGWLALFASPDHVAESLAAVGAGRSRAGWTLDGFEVDAAVPLVVSDSTESAARRVRAYAALYIGGMGSRQHNFYNALARRMGYPDAADRIQDAYLAKDYARAAAEVPQEFIEATTLIGTRESIAQRLRAYAEAGITTLSVLPFAGSLEARIADLQTAMEALESAGVTQ